MKNSWNQRKKKTIQKQENFAFEFDLVKNKQTKVTWVNDDSKKWEKNQSWNQRRKNIIQIVWQKK